MAKAQRKDLLHAFAIPLPYSSIQQGINNSATIISIPEVIDNNPGQSNDGQAIFMDYLLAVNDKMIRQGFIRKVYSIILAQLLITAGVIAWFMNDSNLQMVVKQNLEPFWQVASLVYLTSVFGIICFKPLRRRVPYNYIVLLLATLSLSTLVGIVTIHFIYPEILIAFGITVAVVLALTILAFQTKIDFTLLSGSVLVFLLVSTLFSIALIYYPSHVGRILCTAAGIMILSLSLVYNTHLMVGGQHHFALYPEEYVFAALTIYVDIIVIFVRMLRILRMCQ